MVHALQPGDMLQLDITGIAHGGVCVARHEGRVVFVADAIPGERVRARVTAAPKKTFVRASTVSVLEPSKDRRPHMWPEADVGRDPEERAGGAEFGHIALARQRQLKAHVLSDSLSRFGGLSDASISRIAPSGVAAEAAPGDDAVSGLGWRTRVRLQVDQSSGIVGPYAVRSRRIIPVTSLPLAAGPLHTLAPLGQRMVGVESLALIAPSADDPRMLVCEPGARVQGAHDEVREVVSGQRFVVRADSFWQVHREAPNLLFQAVRNAVTTLIAEHRFDESAAHLDLFGGVGLLAAAMAEAAGGALRVTTVESDRGASAAAAKNLSGYRGARALRARVDQYLSELLNARATVRERVARATVLLDPPRSGAGGAVCAQLGELAPATIIYLACDPVAFARDAKTLGTLGYQLCQLRAFDLFPHTHHLETFAVFRARV